MSTLAREGKLISVANTKAGKHRFSPEEDETIKTLVKKYGIKNWRNISSHIPGISPRQCRERYCNYLNPDLMNRPWTEDEDSLLIKLYEENGSHWSFIANSFPGRTDIHLRNRMRLLLRRQEKGKFDDGQYPKLKAIPKRSEPRTALLTTSKVEVPPVSIGNIFDGLFDTFSIEQDSCFWDPMWCA